MLFAVLVLPTAAQARSKAFGSRVLHRGAHGSDVRVLQGLLGDAGFETTVDGQFGKGTTRSVKAWEKADKRSVDGRVTKTDAKQLRIDAAAGPSDPVPDEPVGDTADPSSVGGAGFVEVEPATLNADGTASAPASAPAAVQQIIAAGNAIYDKPYRYGGGHGKAKDSGYDCSGSISYALAGAALVKQPLDSTGFESWGDAGPGAWVTVYANAGHAYLVVAGMRYDTSGAKDRDGSRWTDEMRSSTGYTVRHPPGL